MRKIIIVLFVIVIGGVLSGCGDKVYDKLDKKPINFNNVREREQNSFIGTLNKNQVLSKKKEDGIKISENNNTVSYSFKGLQHNLEFGKCNCETLKDKDGKSCTLIEILHLVTNENQETGEREEFLKYIDYGGAICSGIIFWWMW